MLGLRYEFVKFWAEKSPSHSVGETKCTDRCRANMAHGIQSGLRFHTKVLGTFEVIPSSLGNGTRGTSLIRPPTPRRTLQ